MPRRRRGSSGLTSRPASCPRSSSTRVFGSRPGHSAGTPSSGRPSRRRSPSRDSSCVRALRVGNDQGEGVRAGHRPRGGRSERDPRGRAVGPAPRDEDVPPARGARQGGQRPARHLRRGRGRPAGFWAAQAKRLTWDTPWTDVLEWNLPFAKWFVGGKLNVAVNCVDRHVDAGLGRPGRLPLGGRAGRHPDHHLRRPLDHGEPGRQRPDRARRAGRRQGGHLHADDPRDGRRHAGLRPPRRAPHGGLRRLLVGRAARAGSSTATPTSSSPPTAATAGAPRVRSSRRSTRRCRSAPTSSRCSSCAAPARTSAWDDGRDVWWHDLVPPPARDARGRGLRRRAPALHHVHQRHDGQAQGHPPHERGLPHPRRRPPTG